MDRAARRNGRKRVKSKPSRANTKKNGNTRAEGLRYQGRGGGQIVRPDGTKNRTDKRKEGLNKIKAGPKRTNARAQTNQRKKRWANA